jgi:hypothetical protein
VPDLDLTSHPDVARRGSDDDRALAFRDDPVVPRQIAPVDLHMDPCREYGDGAAQLGHRGA